MGEVYLADDLQLGRRVALKLLPPQLVADERAKKRLIREARAAATLDHPNICSIYEIGESDGRSFIAMQHVDGETLAARLQREPIPVAEALDIARQIVDALAAAHDRGIVHRDIKPQNIMLDSRGRVKVLDFGLAKMPADDHADTASALTSPGAVLGTVPYMSPEQVRGEEPDARSDVFSFGSVLYELLTGKPPFGSGSGVDTAAAILTREPEGLETSSANVSPELGRIVRRCLTKDRERRYHAIRDLATDLDNIGRETVPTQGRTPRLTHPRSVAIAAALVLAAAVVVYLRPLAKTGVPHSDRISSLAIMPLKPLDATARDDYFGLGVANAIITKVSKVGGLTVRPTSAVRKYATQDIDALEAGRQLNVDAVLEGAVQRSGDRLRVSVNLLRTADASSLWSDDFNVRATDIFAIQDDISQQIAAKVRVELTPAEQAGLARRHTSSPAAYDYYMKAIYQFGDRQWVAQPRGPSDQAIDLFRQAIELDPNYALAHAQLGYGYAWTAINFENDRGLIDRARQEIDLAERLDPQLPDTHVVRSFILWSQYEGWQAQAAVRELRLAQRYDPAVGHFELSDIYGHIGLDEQHQKELVAALEIDPTSNIIKESWINMLFLRKFPDEGLAAERKFFNRGPRAEYYLAKRMLKEAEPLIAAELKKNPENGFIRAQWAWLLALQGKHREAQAAVPSIVKATQALRGYHHVAHTIACIYALGGNAGTAVKWLRVAADSGQPNYTLCLRESFLDPVRNTPEFVEFMQQLKARWETYRRDFSE
jgi:serine/threonine protein kinase/tetratricopeptide (TPR) repeat protein